MREQFRIALQNLRGNRTRTSLTTLGIVIGVASITLVLALGEGVRQTITRQVSHLGNNIIIVKPGQENVRGLSAYNPYSSAATTSLTERDYETTKKTPNVANVAPIMLLSGSLKNEETTLQSPIIATSQFLPEILGLSVHSGQFIDEQTSRDTIILGQQLAINLFGTDTAMGQSVLVKGRPHTVIGVTKNTRTPINLAGIDLDHAAFISFDAGKTFNQGIGQIQQLVIQVDDNQAIDQTATRIEEAILKNHTNEHDFSVLTGRNIANHSNDFFSTIIRLTTIVSIITLIVSGIGVMNIMLVGVTERTREIGIRKALGATDQHIMGQFIIEALIMCISGGTIGIVLAYLLAFVIGSQLYFQPSLSPYIFITGFGLALIVGVIFGLYPALKAARKDPIDALRQYQ